MSIWAVIPLVSCLIFASLAVVAFRQERTPVIRAFSLFLIANSVWSFFSFLLHLNAQPQYSLLWNQLLIAAIPWVAVSYYHFVRAYNNREDSIGLYLGYGFIVAILVLSLNGYLVEYAYVIDGVLFHDIGFSVYIIGGVSSFFLINAVLMLAKRHRTSFDRS